MARLLQTFSPVVGSIAHVVVVDDPPGVPSARE
jgi:hypothetical protein